MKIWQILASVLAGSGLIVGILFVTPVLGSDSNLAQGSVNGEFTLYAGQSHNAGSGTVINDGDSLNFSINTSCLIGCIKVAYWDAEGDLPSNPAPGLFPYSYNCNSSWMTGLIEFEVPFNPGNYASPIIIALHADTVNCGSVYMGTETAWACGASSWEQCPSFPGASWAYYFEYEFID